MFAVGIGKEGGKYGILLYFCMCLGLGRRKTAGNGGKGDQPPRFRRSRWIAMKPLNILNIPRRFALSEIWSFLHEESLGFCLISTLLINWKFSETIDVLYNWSPICWIKGYGTASTVPPGTSSHPKLNLCEEALWPL